jgi:hypothetical protein
MSLWGPMFEFVFFTFLILGWPLHCIVLWEWYIFFLISSNFAEIIFSRSTYHWFCCEPHLCSVSSHSHRCTENCCVASIDLKKRLTPDASPRITSTKIDMNPRTKWPQDGSKMDLKTKTATYVISSNKPLFLQATTPTPDKKRIFKTTHEHFYNDWNWCCSAVQACFCLFLLCARASRIFIFRVP